MKLSIKVSKRCCICTTHTHNFRTYTYHCSENQIKVMVSLTRNEDGETRIYIEFQWGNHSEDYNSDMGNRLYGLEVQPTRDCVRWHVLVLV